jgi:EAL domain-containing protein (putative c-di-GMP-specific phosphodiesterase class I)
MTLLERLLADDGVSVVFQAIFELRAGGLRPCAVECLARGPRGTPFEQPAVFFDYVRRKGAEGVMDRHCSRVALAALARDGQAAGIGAHLNVHARTLSRDPGFPDFLLDTAQAALPSLPLTVEIVEYGPGGGGSLSYVAALERLRSSGVRIALDDVGRADSNFQMVLDCRPDYYKLDAYFVQGVHRDRGRQAVVECVMTLAERLGGRVVAEGVDAHEDFQTLAGLGVDLFQGHLLAAPRPTPDVSRIAPAARELVPADPPSRHEPRVAGLVAESP